MAQAKNPKYTTPKAVASYPYFNKPDDFKGSVAYKADLVMDREEAAELMALCEKTLTSYVESYNEKVAASGKGKKLNLKKALVGGMPWDDHETDETKVVFKVKQNHIVMGEKVTLVIYDAKGKRISKPPVIRGGSVVKVAGTVRGYDGFGGGVTLSISAVQIIELGGGSSDGLESGDGFGFGEEEGFEAEDSGFTAEPDGFEGDDEEEDDDEDF